MDSFWLLLAAGGIAFYLWNRSSKRESPPDWAVAPPVAPVADESPITQAEWQHFRKVAEAAIAQTNGGSVRYIEKKRLEHGNYHLVVRRWNSDKLIKWQHAGPQRHGMPSRIYCPSGVSAELWSQQLRVWTGERAFTDWQSPANRTGQHGPWNAELRGMIKAIESTLQNPVS